MFDRPAVSSALFFKYNTALGPPYRVIVDTNFINFSIQNKVNSAKRVCYVLDLLCLFLQIIYRTMLDIEKLVS